MFWLNVIMRPVVTIGFILIALRSLQALQIEKILKKNRLIEARIIVLFTAICLGNGVASFLFSISDHLVQNVKLFFGQ